MDIKQLYTLVKRDGCKRPLSNIKHKVLDWPSARLIDRSISPRCGRIHFDCARTVTCPVNDASQDGDRESRSLTFSQFTTTAGERNNTPNNDRPRI